MIDTRFTLWVLGLMALAAVPTTLHSYLELRSDDRLRTEAVSRDLMGLSSRHTDRPADWILDRYGSHDWIERMYRRPGQDAIQVFVARSFDPKLIYHHPEAAIATESRTGDYATEFRTDGVTQLSVQNGLPVHVLRGRYGRGLGVYALHYGDGFVANPYLFQLRSALGLLFSPRKPMTLFFIHDRSADPDLSIAKAEVTQLLVATIDSFLSQSR